MILGNESPNPLRYGLNLANIIELIEEIEIQLAQKQRNLWLADSGLWKPSSGTNNGTGLNYPQTVSGTVSYPSVVTGSLLLSLRRMRLASSNVAGNTAGIRSAVLLVGGENSYIVQTRFNLLTNTNFNLTQGFFGLLGSLGFPAGNISGLTNYVGVGYESTDLVLNGTWFAMSKGAGGVQEKYAIPGLLRTDLNQVLELSIIKAQSVNGIRIHLYNWSTNTLLYNAIHNINIPLDTVYLNPILSLRNGVQNIAMEFEVNNIFWETYFSQYSRSNNDLI